MITMLNMLIAIMGDTFERITENSELNSIRTICPGRPNFWGPFVPGDRKWGTGSPVIKWAREQLRRSRGNIGLLVSKFFLDKVSVLCLLVSPVNDLVPGGEPLDDLHRTEDLLLIGPAVLVESHEDRRLQEEAVLHAIGQVPRATTTAGDGAALGREARCCGFPVAAPLRGCGGKKESESAAARLGCTSTHG